MLAMSRDAPLVCILRAARDEGPLRDLLRHFLLSEKQGVVRLWTRSLIRDGEDKEQETAQALPPTARRRGRCA